MADFDTDPLKMPAPRHDGQVICNVCGSTDLDSSHEWCARFDALLCDHCCHRLLLIGISDLESDQEDEPGSGCAACERGREWFTNQVFRHAIRGWEVC